MDSYGILIGNGYRLNRIIACAKDKNHIPFNVGCIIVGPYGGKYILDTFGLEQLCRLFKMTRGCTCACGYVRSVQGTELRCPIIYGNPILTADNDKLNTNEKVMRAFANSNGFKFIARKSVNKFLMKMYETK